MKYCTAKHAKDAKLRFQRLCALCALCGETLNGTLQSACLCVSCCPAPTPFSHSPAIPASALYPATAARKGGSVAASLVDSCEFRTPDKRK